MTERVLRPAICDSTQYPPIPDAELEAWLAAHPEKQALVDKMLARQLAIFPQSNRSQKARETAKRLALRLAYALAHSSKSG